MKFSKYILLAVGFMAATPAYSAQFCLTTQLSTDKSPMSHCETTDDANAAYFIEAMAASYFPQGVLVTAAIPAVPAIPAQPAVMSVDGKTVVTPAVAAVPGVDVLFIGTSDLTAELGISGQMGHQKVIDAYQAVGEACRKHGKTLGMGGVYDEVNAARYVGMGARFLLTGADHSYILSGANQRSAFFNHLPGAPV